MRIIAGSRRGMALQAPAGDKTRPTSDRARQTLFDILTHGSYPGWPGVAGGPALDAFAGSGAIGLEALSRGATNMTFIEQDRSAIASIRANIAKMKAEAACCVIAGSVLKPPTAKTPCTLVFLDPPYAQDLVQPGLLALLRGGWIDDNALIVGEIGADEAPPFSPIATRKVGAALFCFWRKSAIGE